MICPLSDEEFDRGRYGDWASFRYMWEAKHGFPPRQEGLAIAKVQTELRDLISSNMRDSSQLYGLGPVFHFRDLEKIREKEKSFCENIAGAAAEAIVQAEMSAVLERWKGLIEEHGLEKVAGIYTGSKLKGNSKEQVVKELGLMLITARWKLRLEFHGEGQTRFCLIEYML